MPAYLPHATSGRAFALMYRRSRKLLAPRPDLKYLICTGVSGLSIAAPLAISLRRYLVVIRKGSIVEPSHGTPIEAPTHFGRRAAPDNCCIIDDFICTGATLKRLHDRLLFFSVFRPTFHLLYGYTGDDGPRDYTDRALTLIASCETAGLYTLTPETPCPASPSPESPSPPCPPSATATAPTPTPANP